MYKCYYERHPFTMNILPIVYTVSLFLTSIILTSRAEDTDKSQTKETARDQKIEISDYEKEIAAGNKPNSKDERRLKIDQIPKDMIEYFTNSEFPAEQRLDNPASYEESNNDPFKKAFEEFQKYAPFMIQREKVSMAENLLASSNKKTVYFQASTLNMKLLTINDLKDPKNTNQLTKLFRQKNLSEDDFNRRNYYYWLFSSGENRKRLISACPDDKRIEINFPAGEISEEDLDKLDKELEKPLELDSDAEFSSDEDNDTTSLSSLEHSKSKHTSSSSSSPERSKSKNTSSPSSPEREQLKKPISAGKELPSASPTITDVSAKANQSPIGSSLSKKIKKKASKWFDSTFMHFLSKISSPPGNESKKIVIMNTFKGRVLKPREVVEENEYMASNFPCKFEPKPSFVKHKLARYADIYDAGYLVDFGKKVDPLYGHLLKVSETTLWFHIAHLLMDNKTKDTYSVFSYAPFYEHVDGMQNIPIYTDYTINENTLGDLEYYKRMYSEENQKKVFECFENHEKYFDPENSLVLVKQELMDQKSVVPMTHKRVALDYMNIAPMYKIIKDMTWSKVENVVLKLPMVSDASAVSFVTGTYGSLKINDSTEGLYLDKDGELNGIKRIKVPYAFYKVVHIEYQTPRLGDSIATHLKFFFSIVIVTHNDPFETDLKKICDKPVECQSVGWKKVEQENPKFGFTYCCEFTEKFSQDMEILPMYKSFMTREVLDLRVLWYAEAYQASSPLNINELQDVKILKEATSI